MSDSAEKDPTMMSQKGMKQMSVTSTITTNFNPGYSTAAGLYQSLFGFILIMTVNTLLRKYKPEYALF